MNHTDNSNKNIQHIEYLSSDKALHHKRLQLYTELNSKIDMFETCLNDIKLTHGYPYLDFNRSFLGKLFKFPRVFPVDSSEEALMRNSMRNHLAYE